MVDVNNEEELEEFLRALPHQARVSFAVRAALRVAPYTFRYRDHVDENFDGSVFLLACLRANLVSGVAGTWPTPDTREIDSAAHSALSARPARSAHSAAHSAVAAAHSAAHSAVAAAHSAVAAALSARSALSADSAAAAALSADSAAAAALSAAPDQSQQIFATPLWPTQVPEKVSEAVETFEEAAPGTPWAFWARWYRGMLDGKPLDWGLQRRVALIDDAIWKAGPKAVAQEIARIEAAFLAEKLPLAETVELNPDTGRFRVVPIPVQNPPLMSALLTHISDALEDALQGANGLSDRSSEYRKITRAVTRYGNNPQQAELTLTVVAKGLRRQIHDTGELPDSEDNIALLEAVEEGVRGIRANHPEVAANREQLARQALSELGTEDKALLEQAAPVLIEISEEEMAEDFAEDIPALVNDALLPLPSGAPPLPSADSATRIFSRVSRMAMILDGSKKMTRRGAKAFDSDLAKTGRLIEQLGKGLDGAWWLINAIIQMGLRILGVF